MNKDYFQKELCRQLCTDIKLVERKNGIMMISNPFSYPDGDHYSIYIKEIRPGMIRISDEANTMMRLSYDTPNVGKYFKDSKGKLMKQILRENQVEQDDGNFYIDTSVDKLSENIFRLGQALSQIYDLSYLNRDHNKSTFYEELGELLTRIISKYPPIGLEKDYEVPQLEKAENYVVDYSLQRESKENLLFLFGIPNKDKAKLVTITLQYLLLNRFNMPTLLIFENQEEIPSIHVNRLMDANIRGSQVSSISSEGSIEQNIRAYAAV